MLEQLPIMHGLTWILYVHCYNMPDLSYTADKISARRNDQNPLNSPAQALH